MFRGAWLTLTDGLMAAAILVWAGSFLFRKPGQGIQRFPLLPLFVLLILTFFISGTKAIDQQLVIKEALKYVSLFLFFYVLTDRLTKNTLLKAASIISCSVSALCVWFIVDFLMGHVDPYHRLWFRRVLADVHLNAFAAQVVVAIPFTLFVFFHSSTRVSRLSGLGCFLITMAALVLTYSRANWIAAAIMLVIVLFYEFRLKGAVAAVLVLAMSFIVVATAFPHLRLSSRITSIVDGHESSILARKEHIMAAASFIREYPLTGVGLGNFKQAARKYQNRDLTEMVHNMFLQFGAETGLISMAALAAVVAIALYLFALSIRRNSSDSRYRALLLYLAMAFAGLLISGQFGDPFVRGLKEYFIVLLAVCFQDNAGSVETV